MYTGNNHVHFETSLKENETLVQNGTILAVEYPDNNIHVNTTNLNTTTSIEDAFSI